MSPADVCSEPIPTDQYGGYVVGGSRRCGIVRRGCDEPAIDRILYQQRTLPTKTHPPGAGAVSFRTVSLADAREIWALVRASRVLDPNSLYLYLLLCRDFAETCLVACRDSEVVGFVTAYRPPGRPDTIFVWQVGVAQGVRRQGLARRLLHALLALPACRGVRFLELTVTPSNLASRRLFQSFADDLAAPCHVQQAFTAELFGSENHEEEELFRIGPFYDSPKESRWT